MHEAWNGIDNESETLFARPQRILCASASSNIGIDSDPFDNVAFAVAQSTPTKQKPAVLAVVSPHTAFCFEQPTRPQGSLVVFHHPRHIVLMNGDQEAPADRLLHRKTRVLQPLLI